LRIALIHGPNLNLLGKREVNIYGNESFDDVLNQLESAYPSIKFFYDQSNVEGEIVNFIQERDGVDYIILNAAAYTHTSIAIADAVAAIQTPVIGIHISNIYQREKERHIDLLAKNCIGCLFGFGLHGYRMAVDFCVQNEADGE
jgi:3-dehydroquinate dehydratase-2